MSFSVASYKQGMRNQVLQRNLKWKKKSLKKQKRYNLIHTRSEKASKGTVVNRDLPSLYMEGHLKLSLQSL